MTIVYEFDQNLIEALNAARENDLFGSASFTNWGGNEGDEGDEGNEGNEGNEGSAGRRPPPRTPNRRTTVGGPPRPNNPRWDPLLPAAKIVLTHCLKWI